jgi:hypothetical protein
VFFWCAGLLSHSFPAIFLLLLVGSTKYFSSIPDDGFN